MKKMVNQWLGFERVEVAAAAALEQFSGNEYKQELINEFAGEGQTLSLYKSGKFTDLCRGGHIEAPNKELKHFKLLSVAGAYWRGDEKNKMLTRIYGTAFFSKEELADFVEMREEAKRRDHKKLGKELDLFLISPAIGSGLPIFTPKGLILRQQIENFVIKEKKQRGYQFVWSPHIAHSKVYVTSGHWQKYDAMFNSMKLDDDEYVLKPMNCPHHFQVYKNKPRSYRDMPYRIAENGTVYRYEKSGEVNGLLRVRALTVDDTHTFVRHNQVASEIDKILELVEHVFKTFGFESYSARISVRDSKDHSKYMGDMKNWDTAEDALIEAVKQRGWDYEVGENEAAFYGPKIDVMVHDSLGREWQLSTCQLDFVQPENFDLSYVSEAGEQERPAVLHIAILGSVERFMGIMIEHYAGAFPVWLAPVQVKVLPIADRHFEYAQQVAAALEKVGGRVEVDESSERLSKKIRTAQVEKVPYMLVVGDTEVEAGQVGVRSRSGGDSGAVKLEEFVEQLEKEAVARS
jgi:threonyl-tRNA synthetase